MIGCFCNQAISPTTRVHERFSSGGFGLLTFAFRSGLIDRMEVGTMRYVLRSTRMALLILITSMSLTPANASDGPLATKDQTALRALLEQFRRGWLSGNPDTIRRTLARAAVIRTH